MAEVQKAARSGQKIKRRLGIAARALENATALAGPFPGFLQMEEQRKPDGQVIVAQAARTLLQVGLQMENGVAILRVPRAGQFPSFCVMVFHSLSTRPGRTV